MIAGLNGTGRTARCRPRDGPAVLIVADNTAWSLAIANAAHRRGLDVHVANSAAAALRKARRRRDIKYLLFTAVVLPDASGLALAERLRRIHPGLKAIYVSSDDDPVAISGALDARSGFLFWPFRQESLFQKIDWLLKSEAAAGPVKSRPTLSPH